MVNLNASVEEHPPASRKVDKPVDGRSQAMDLSIVMPCLNEAETIGACVRKALKSIASLGIRGEVMVADNGSTDGSIQIAEELGARVVRVAAKGYGNALRGGIEAAHGRWIIMGDSDDSYDFSNLELFLDKFQQGYELVMGCRLPHGGGKIDRKSTRL